MPSLEKTCIFRRHVPIMGERVCTKPHFLNGTLFSRVGGTKHFKYCCSINSNCLKGKIMIWYQIFIGMSHFIVSIGGGSRIKFTVLIWKVHKMAIWGIFCNGGPQFIALNMGGHWIKFQCPNLWFYGSCELQK